MFFYLTTTFAISLNRWTCKNVHCSERLLRICLAHSRKREEKEEREEERREERRWKRGRWRGERSKRGTN